MKAFLENLEQFAIDVILERRHGRAAVALRVLLRALAYLYEGIVVLRLRFFEWRFSRVHALGCQVISVGNLTVGGTGKTPIVEKLARRLTDGGRRVAILSRGYKSTPLPFLQRVKNRLRGRDNASPPRVVSDGSRLLLGSDLAGDEPYMLAKNLRNVVVLVDRDRVKSGLHAIRHFGADVLLLDDGFQYLPLKERFDVVLVDREAPYGGASGSAGNLLPRGMLREPHRHLKRANLLVITKCDGSDLAPLKADLRRHNRHAPFVECSHAPRYLEDLRTGERVPLSLLKGQRVGAVSGIARPESFEGGLRALGAEICYSRSFADHHRYAGPEILNALARSKARNARFVVTTEKDAVRFPEIPLGDFSLPIYFLRVEIELLQGGEVLDALVDRLCATTVPPAKTAHAPAVAHA
ncbi:lipid-A-disaccharide kinase [Verrucomicrobium sp. GAS474]|uniref:tetraacyldisaccharide 4'-kinase n=1 Tax=Verrucomicrobium sp. GAS474 TaxID=1882831 RepID=UPI00087CDE36|nr:tetraacyldisaccharide 4'-kinase [Verrucomicrobium sp. GAS474]SDT87838.1 lipid-A-disaccharide kinase [Verrucomicrobium sp. GAS474]